jgi:hypothetical protein
MPRVAILADTHIPSRATALPGWVEAELQEADHVIHAGDFDSAEAYARIVDLSAGNLTAVKGNMDPASLGLPTVNSVTLGGRTFVVYHGTGSPAGYRQRVTQTVRAETDDTDPIAVAGHTHEVLDVTDTVRILNPGSATGASPASEATMMRATVTDGTLTVEVRRI